MLVVNNVGGARLCNPEKTLKQTCFCIKHVAFLTSSELRGIGGRPCVITTLNYSQGMAGELHLPDPLDCCWWPHMGMKTQVEECHPLNHPYGFPWHPRLAMVFVQELTSPVPASYQGGKEHHPSTVGTCTGFFY